MATVDKLLIKGVRSFSPENTNVITFPKPLTLIVGRNGSGKTTIIECLKHAVTGEWPPNSHAGKSFVHDPKVYGADEVKAQIKLQCKTVTGKPFLVIRSFQLSRKRGKYEFKSLDQNIQISNNKGELEGISKRCADINQEVPQLLGVSKAILENVIFVHQDDSNWPLAEGAVLKKRFDDIFAATKYTKALEAIRKLKTEQAADIKTKRLTLENLKTLKDQAHKLRADLGAAEGARARHLEELKVLVEEAEGKEAELQQLQDTLSRLQGLESELAVLKARRDTVVEDANRRKGALTAVCDEPLEALLKFQQGAAERINKERAELNAMEHELSGVRAQRSHIATQYSAEMAQQNRLQAELEMHNKRVSERKATVANVAERHPDIGMRFVAEPTGEEVQEFEYKAAALMQALQKEFDYQLAINTGCETRATQRVDVATASVASLRESSRQKNAQLRRNDERLIGISNQLKEVRVSERAVQEAQQLMDSTEAQLQKKRADVNASPLSAEVAQLAQSIDRMKAEVAALRRDRDELSSAAGEAAKITVLRNDAKDKDDAAQKLYEERKSSLDVLFGDQQVPAQKDMSASLSSLMTDLSKSGDALEADVRKQRNICAALDGRLSDANAAVQRLKELLARKKESLINTVLGGGAMESFMDRLEGQQRVVEKEADALAVITAWKSVYNAGLANAVASHTCNLCERPFTAPEEAAFVQKIDQKVRQLPIAEQAKTAEHRAAVDLLKTLTQARPTWEDCQRVEKEELPAAEQTAVRLRAEREAAGQELAALEQREGAQKERAASVRSLSAEASTMARLWQEAAELRARADMAQRSIAHMNAASKSMDQLNAEIKAAENRLSVEEHKCQQLRDQVQAMNAEVLNLERASVNCRETLHSAKAEAEKGAQLECERKDLLAQTEVLKREMADLDRQLTAAEAERVSADTAREQTRQECTAALNARSARLRELQRDMDGYMMQSHAIKAYLDAGKDQELQRTIQSVQAVQAKLAANHVAMTALEDKMNALNESSRNRDRMKRDVDDNVAYLQGVQQALELKEAIDRNTAASAQFGNLAALQQDVERVNDELQRIRNQQHALRGRMETHGEQATKCKTELKAPAYKDIDERFRQENIAVRTTEMANDDLNKYYTALDKALMAFHASKMAEINKVIRELWQKTYRNPDIDHIAIVSDAESATSSGRSYNYRVVMRNREEELDMRGRCSAGQKVLACLIIRLALAETFCLNCGILALDEPTTNLDAANSASLAQALTDIMNARREQTNFQLIIITHDIKFAHLIGQREHADFYWRISKDDALHSHIEQEDIYE